MSEEIIGRRFQLSSFQIIILGFVGVILLVALLLMLAISTTERCVTPFNEVMFTATSAVCEQVLCYMIPAATGHPFDYINLLYPFRQILSFIFCQHTIAHTKLIDNIALFSWSHAHFLSDIFHIYL